MDNFKPQIGKNIIENLTIGMYDDPRFVYREYIQNAADQIDLSLRKSIIASRDEGSIYIQTDSNKRSIIIEDNATGIEAKKVLHLLGNIAQSTKNRNIDKGFRGIGRLGGLGYCEKLTFETSFFGESIKSIMIWDAKQLRNIINDSTIQIEAAELISVITDYNKENEELNSHYFRVTMEGVTNDTLLDVKKVSEYLSMVAPLPFSSSFRFKSKIYKEAKLNNVLFDEYKIYVNHDQLFKSYINSIYRDKKIIDEIIDVEFFKEYKDEQLIYWGWYGISKNMQQIPEDENKEIFIRLRKSNIQIGLDKRLDRYHREEVGNRYFIGEVHAISSELIPNARRDFFIDNEYSDFFEKKLRQFFHTTLYPLYYDFSKKNSAFKEIQEAKKLIEEYSKKEENGLLNKIDGNELVLEIEKKQKKAEKAKNTLSRLSNKYKGQSLSLIIEESEYLDNIDKTIISEKPPTINYTVEKISKYSKLTNNEELLIQRIYQVIKNVLTIELSINLIDKIDKELKSNY